MLKRYVLFAFIVILSTACTSKYLDESKIMVDRFSAADAEIKKNKTLFLKIFYSKGGYHKVGLIDSASFNRNAARLFPKLYKLFKDHDVTEFEYRSDKCMYYTIKEIRGLITDKILTLKPSGMMNCEYDTFRTTVLLDQKKLSNGWVLEIHRVYFD